MPTSTPETVSCPRCKAAADTPCVWEPPDVAANHPGGLHVARRCWHELIKHAREFEDACSFEASDVMRRELLHSAGLPISLDDSVDRILEAHHTLIALLGQLQFEVLRGEALDPAGTAGTIQHTLARLLHALLALTPGAQNHIAVDLPPLLGETRRWSLTLQREDGLTPAQRLRAQEARIQELEAAQPTTSTAEAAWNALHAAVADISTLHDFAVRKGREQRPPYDLEFGAVRFAANVIYNGTTEGLLEAVEEPSPQ